MKKFIEIDNRKIGKNYPPFIIAEISGNHDGSFSRAIKLIDIAVEAGADAVKFQTFKPESLTFNTNDKRFAIMSGSWKGKKLFDVYEQAMTPWEWFYDLFAYSKKRGITAFSSPFDHKAVEFLESLNCPAYKIASNELNDFYLIDRVIETNKPIIFSTGVASKEDINSLKHHLSKKNFDKYILLHCVSEYPASHRNSNLKTMQEISENNSLITGFSDHTLGITSSLAAVAIGASVIEKHITISHDDGAIDSHFSLEPEELNTLCSESKKIWESIGKVKYGKDTDLWEKGIFTRQFWSNKLIRKNEIITKENISSVRAPSNEEGICPSKYEELFGRQAKRDIDAHSPIIWDDIV